MGCDGGTIPKRDELVRTKKKKEQKDKVSEKNFLWRHCSITQTPLSSPIVACGLGRLYNKDSVIMGILDKGNFPEVAKHIKNLKDVKELQLTPNPVFNASAIKGDSYDDHLSAPYICPLVGIEMNGNFKFCFSWSCGCVLSERAFKELKSNLCQKCQKPISSEDIVVLNPVGDDIEANRKKMEERQAKLKAEKKSKKKVETNETPLEDKKNGESKATSSKKQIPGENGIKRPAAGSLGMQVPDFKKTKGSYSVAQDPNASTVYKSLFTSSSAAKTQDKAHWITYNPFYN
ncbi:protein RTF2 homolog [Cimex lectularius]|uniref:Replication termination factor 2 n=1 Tax=Cimex lectularius TaxID=79782 RepID=A0A8I6RL55_CIMLE|nr:protein RTF2 homolog [Cimex lectularius]XP_014244125.1 protein RTF2 homolog [Cimex lectularius]XP_024080559.1 protein RTF2 homolog [Cimex lectularius]